MFVVRACHELIDEAAAGPLGAIKRRLRTAREETFLESEKGGVSGLSSERDAVCRALTMCADR
jgi:hypothetical protein